MSTAKRILEIIKEAKAKAAVDQATVPLITSIFLTKNGRDYRQLDEGRKWVDGRFKNNIGIDQPTHGAGQTHGHVLGRKGKQVVVVNVDGSGSHGTKGKLHDKDAQALRDLGFNIPDDNIIEWKLLPSGAELLLG